MNADLSPVTASKQSKAPIAHCLFWVSRNRPHCTRQTNNDFILESR